MVATADPGFYKNALLALATASVVVPVMHRLRLSPVLGYLGAGALLGANGIGALADRFTWLHFLTFSDEKEIAAFAELGVVFLLFVIGLELSAERLMTMRRLIFGMGGLQVALSAAALGLVAPHRY